MEYTPLSQLEVGQRGYKILCHLARLWNSTNPLLQDQFITLDLLLVDKEGTSIQASIRKEDAVKMQEMLVEQKIYVIANFMVGNPRMNFRVCNHKNVLRLGTWTIIKEIEDEDLKIPINAFELADKDMLEKRIYNDIFLTDVIGQLVKVGALEESLTNGRMVGRRSIIIQSSEFVNMSITLWGAVAETFSKTNVVVLHTKDPVVAVFAAMTVRSFKAETTLSSTSATKIYLNLPIPEVESFRKRIIIPAEVSLENTNEELAVEVQDDRQIIEKTIVDLLSQNPFLHGNTKSICRSKITAIDSSKGWWYNACAKCKTSVSSENDVMNCKRCGPISTMPIPWYKVNVEVADDTGIANFMMFGKDVERLIKVPASTVCNLPGSNKFKIPEIMNEIMGKTFKFFVSRGERDYDSNTSTFKVFSVSIDDEEHSDQTEYYESKKKLIMQILHIKFPENNNLKEKLGMGVEVLSDDEPLSNLSKKKKRVERYSLKY